MEFFITQGNGDHVFSLVTVQGAPPFGSLRLFTSLDYEVKKEYTLQVVATDHRQKSGPAVITVTVCSFFLANVGECTFLLVNNYYNLTTQRL